MIIHAALQECSWKIGQRVFSCRCVYFLLAERIKNGDTNYPFMNLNPAFQDSFIANLLRIIQHMKPKHRQDASSQPQNEKDRLAEKFPGLAIPNDPKFESRGADKRKKEKKKSVAEDDIVNDAMAELEALAPSQIRFVCSLCFAVVCR